MTRTQNNCPRLHGHVKKEAVNSWKRFFWIFNKKKLLTKQGQRFQAEVGKNYALLAKERCRRYGSTQISFLSSKEKDAIDSDIAFLKSMMADRQASYTGRDKILVQRFKKCLERSYLFF